MRTDAALVSAQSRSKRLANAYRRVAPTINAASSKSRGMVTMYERSRKVENVANRAAWMIMTPSRLLISPSCYGRSGSVCGGPHVANETSDVRSVSLPVGLADTRGQTAMV